MLPPPLTIQFEGTIPITHRVSILSNWDKIVFIANKSFQWYRTLSPTTAFSGIVRYHQQELSVVSYVITNNSFQWYRTLSPTRAFSGIVRYHQQQLSVVSILRLSPTTAFSSVDLLLCVFQDTHSHALLTCTAPCMCN